MRGIHHALGFRAPSGRRARATAHPALPLRRAVAMGTEGEEGAGAISVLLDAGSPFQGNWRSIVALVIIVLVSAFYSLSPKTIL